MNKGRKAYLIGGGIGNLAAAAFLIRDGGMLGESVVVLEAASALGGSLAAAGTATLGYSMRGGRMLTTDNYECTWDLYKTIPSIQSPDKTVYQETVEFNELHRSHSTARLVDRRRARVPVRALGFSMHDRVELLQLSVADEQVLAGSRITDWLSPAFFETPFWIMWSTTRLRSSRGIAQRSFVAIFTGSCSSFSRIETLGGVKRTVFNQYDSLVRPLQAWLEKQGVCMRTDCTVTDIASESIAGLLVVTGMDCRTSEGMERIHVNDGDLVFFQNGSMTDASSLGSMTAAPAHRSKVDSGGWALWEKLADGRPELGNPAAFNGSIAQSSWDSFTVTTTNSRFFDEKCSGSAAMKQASVAS